MAAARYRRGVSRDPAVVLANLARIRAGIERACERSRRDPASVRLVAAAKTVEPEAVAWVREAGVRDVGENYVAELRAKRGSVPGMRRSSLASSSGGSFPVRTAQRIRPGEPSDPAGGDHRVGLPGKSMQPSTYGPASTPRPDQRGR